MTKRQITKELCLEIASSCFNRNELQKKDCYIYKVMYKNGWLEEVFPKSIMKPEKYTYDQLKEITLKYKSKNSFKWGDYNAYHRARTRPYFEEICSHMKPVCRSDNNVLYIVRVIGQNNLYKIGITSLRCKNMRFNSLKHNSGYEYEIIKKIVLDNAVEVEKKLLSFGKKCELPVFSGYTEFRIFTDEELYNVLQVIEIGG